MTFSVIQIDHCIRKVVGRIWASDESIARALAPVLITNDERLPFSIERFEECEIPLKINEEFRCPTN